MREQVLQQVRSDVATLLAQPTEALDADQLLGLIQQNIAQEHQARAQAAGGACTLTLNGLLNAEMNLRTGVFGQKRPEIKADF